MALPDRCREICSDGLNERIKHVVVDVTETGFVGQSILCHSVFNGALANTKH